ncbi:hypothetical protein MCGE09_00183 [Thaumarchaeota archaeon SCGC AB-539-E09]|nr:hypothetical protein MCGE09_00183 [Thaumarchaeota archaeon SCGC AB-539-E09]
MFRISKGDFVTGKDAAFVFNKCYNSIKEARDNLKNNISFNESFEWAFIEGPTSQGTGFYNYHLLAMWETVVNAHRSEYVHRSDLDYFFSAIQSFASQHTQVAQLFTQLRSAREQDADDDAILAITLQLWSYINMRCFEPLGDPNAPSFRGLWKTSYGYYYLLEQHGGTLTGRFWNESGDRWGTIEGRVHNSSIQGEMKWMEGTDQPPYVPIEMKEGFSFNMRDDEYYFAGELRKGDEEKDPGHARRITGLNPGKTRKVKDEFLQSKWKGETYESIFHGLAEDATKFPRELFGTEEGGPIIQPGKLVDKVGDALYELVTGDGVDLLGDTVEDELEDLIEDETDYGNPLFQEAYPERYKAAKEGLDASKELAGEVTKQFARGLVEVYEGGTLEDPRKYIMNAYRTLQKGKSNELEDKSEDWDPSTDDEEVPDEDAKWKVNVPIKFNSPDVGSMGEWDENISGIENYFENTRRTGGTSLIKRVGIELEATLPKGDKASLEVGLENPGNLFYPDFSEMGSWKTYVDFKIKAKRWGGLEFLIRGEYSEEESRVSANVAVPLEKEHRPYTITFPDEEDELEP